VTSRELTGILSLGDADASASRRRPSDALGDWAWRIGFGAISWPWLLASLSGGRKADKRALLDELGLPHDALPHLGSWKADVGFLRHIVREIAELRPAHVVELGAGASTLIAARALALHGGGRLTSFDQHDGFVQATRNWLADHGLTADLRHAPLAVEREDWPGRWYDIDSLPERIDLLIIDGPPWAVHPMVRGAADSLFSRLSPGAVVLLDDAARPGERLVARRWRKRWPHIEFRLRHDGTKGTLVGRRRDPSLPVANDNDHHRLWRHLGRAAGIVALIATGWIARGELGEFPQPAQASAFLDEAAASHRTGLLRQSMTSQVESATLSIPPKSSIRPVSSCRRCPPVGMSKTCSFIPRPTARPSPFRSPRRRGSSSPSSRTGPKPRRRRARCSPGAQMTSSPIGRRATWPMP